MLDSLAQLLFRRRRAVLVAGFLAVALAGVLGGPVAGLLTRRTTSILPPRTPSRRASGSRRPRARRPPRT